MTIVTSPASPPEARRFPPPPRRFRAGWGWPAAAATSALGSVAACSIAGPTTGGARETAWIAGFALTIILAARLGRRPGAARPALRRPRD